MDTRQETQAETADERFFPSGSIAFFVVLMLLYGVIWQGMYLLTILRS